MLIVNCPGSTRPRMNSFAVEERFVRSSSEAEPSKPEKS
jgi:hypothetical protein